eukprot:TRINITY_DN1848_c0_g3_i1.p1 TRINITY_DN1848_c0_g3~~TRINITY_DN1848_c0_g3_i1.p1  ORF type:complete len:812 (+),score=322.00 TRINITY_DN1848_c0_g3_i1:50-2485(+)
MSQFKFTLSSEIDQEFVVTILSLKGERKKESLPDIIDQPLLPYSGLYSEQFSQLFVTAELINNSKYISYPIQTPFKYFTDKYSWDEELKFPIKFKDLPVTTQLLLKVYDIYGPCKAVIVGQAYFKLFSKSRTLRTGMQKVLLCTDPQIISTRVQTNEAATLNYLEKLMKKKNQKQIQSCDWQDKLVEAEIERIRKQAAEKHPNDLYLYFELCTFQYTVLFNEISTSNSSKNANRNNTSVNGDIINDPELYREEMNPVDYKYSILTKSDRNILPDKNLKPNLSEKEILKRAIAKTPFEELTPEEKSLLWRFRYYLTSNKKALTKFLRCLELKEFNLNEAIELLTQWEPIEPQDALELLTKKFPEQWIREYAVKIFAKVSDEELCTYLLQLVQALRYENNEGKNSEPLTNLLISKAISNQELASYLNWYLMLERKPSNCYDSKYLKFFTALKQKSSEIHQILFHQKDQLDSIFKYMNDLKSQNTVRTKKIEQLKEALSSTTGALYPLTQLEDFVIPLNPKLKLGGVIPETATIFKSAMLPMALEFKVLNSANSENIPNTYKVIFKSGDDLRQDQLIIQMILLMDQLLKKENLDLKLTPYRVIATGPTDGLVECVPRCSTIAHILKQHDNDIRKFLMQPDSNQIKPAVLDNFVRSCAGYCVITFILGIGDRHLDNLLMTEEGNLFHIDFGYILGNDPKPFAPPMKLCKEMVEAMGGATNPNYAQFKQYCCEAYNILRRSAKLILNLFLLMIDADIPHISLEGEKSILRIQNNFNLHYTDAEAIQFFQNLINESVSALFPQITEKIHSWAQYWRS